MALDDSNGGIGGIFQGIGEAFKNQYNIQMARRTMDMKQQELDSDTKYKNAQVDYLEDRGSLAGSQADAYRFLINRADKTQQTNIDAGNNQIDAAHVQNQQQGQSYQALLSQALKTPEGQNYVANSMGGVTDTTGMPQGEGMSGTPSPGAMSQAMGPSSTVNTIMPGVGASEPPPVIPVSSRGVGTELNRMGGAGGPQGKRNTSLQKAMGTIESMNIDNRDDAQYAMEKYYGADWAQNPEAVQFMNAKFGPAQPAAASPAAGGTGGAGGPAAPAGDFVPVTGPDGTNYKVPRANLQKALQRGYRVRQ